MGNLGACLGGVMQFIGGGVVGAGLLVGQFLCGGNMFVGEPAI